MAERLVSPETTKKVEIGGVIAGLLGMVSGLAALELGFVAAGGAVIYDMYEHRKGKK
jgi:hypothetical protein